MDLRELEQWYNEKISPIQSRIDQNKLNHDQVINGMLAEHNPYQSPYAQFQQQYPQLDQYGRKVLSGGYLKENINNFSNAMANARGQAFEGQPDTGRGNIMDYFGPVGMVKGISSVPWKMTRAEYDAPVKLKPEEYKYIDIGGKKVEVAQNPSNQELSNMKKEAIKKYGEPANGDPALRFTADADGNRYYWNAGDAIHAHIEPEITKKFGAEVNQNAAQKQSHRGIVRRALYEGENVPENVISEYPGIIEEVVSIKGNRLLPEVLKRQSGTGYDQLQKQTDTIPEMLKRQSGL